jgi:hypothetical protein
MKVCGSWSIIRTWGKMAVVFLLIGNKQVGHGSAEDGRDAGMTETPSLKSHVYVADSHGTTQHWFSMKGVNPKEGEPRDPEPKEQVRAKGMSKASGVGMLKEVNSTMGETTKWAPTKDGCLKEGNKVEKVKAKQIKGPKMGWVKAWGYLGKRMGGPTST